MACSRTDWRSTRPHKRFDAIAGFGVVDVDIQTLTEAIDCLAAAGPMVPADPESIEALMTQRARLDAVVTEAAASFEASRDGPGLVARGHQRGPYRHGGRAGQPGDRRGPGPRRTGPL